MLKLLSIPALFLSTLSLADGIGPNSLPIFYTFIGENPKYHDAVCKAQEAFFMQTGVTPMFNKVNDYVSNRVTTKVSTTIDRSTPFASRHVYFIAGTIYVIGVKKQVSQSFRNPLWSRLNHSITLSATEVSTSIRLSF